MKERSTPISWRGITHWLLPVAVVLLLYLRFEPTRSFILESCLYLGLLWFIAQQESLRSPLQALRLSYRVFLVILVLLMLGGQLVDRGNDTFPFVGWSMYTRSASSDPQYYDYTAVLQSGQERRLEV